MGDTVVAPTSTAETGASGPTDRRLEAFDVELPDQTDVLFVVDNSATMEAAQAELATRLPGFMGFLQGSGIDYHIGATTTTTAISGSGSSGNLTEFRGQRFVEEGTPDALVVLEGLIRVGNTGSSNENGLLAAGLALAEPPPVLNEGFRRAEGSLHVVVLSDEDDESSITPSQYVAGFRTLRPDTSDLSFSSIVSLKGFEPGTKYLDVTREIGGIVYDIDGLDFADAMQDLGALVSKPTSRFGLEGDADPETLDVEIVRGAERLGLERAELDRSGSVVAGGWTYEPDKNLVAIVGFVVEVGDVVEVRYDLR